LDTEDHAVPPGAPVSTLAALSHPDMSVASPLPSFGQQLVSASPDLGPIPGTSSLMILSPLDWSMVSPAADQEQVNSSVDTADANSVERDDSPDHASSLTSQISLTSRCPDRRARPRPELQRTRRLVSAIAGPADPGCFGPKRRPSVLQLDTRSSGWTREQSEILASASLALMDLDTACALLPGKTRTQCRVHKRTQAFKAVLKRLLVASAQHNLPPASVEDPIAGSVAESESDPSLLHPRAPLCGALPSVPAPLSTPPSSEDLTSGSIADSSDWDSSSGTDEDLVEDNPMPPALGDPRGAANESRPAPPRLSDAQRGFQSLFGRTPLPLPIQRIRALHPILSVVPNPVVPNSDGTSRKRELDSSLPPRKRLRQDDRWASQSRWTPSETAALVAAVKAIGLGDNDGLAARVGTKTGVQCSDHLRTDHVKSLLAGETVAPGRTRQGFVSRHWTDEEHSRLLDALNSQERFNPARIQAAVGSRSADQVSRKIEQLLATGTIARGPDGLYAFTRDVRQRAARKQSVDPLTTLLGPEFFSSSGATAPPLSGPAPGALSATGSPLTSPASDSAPAGSSRESSSAARFDSPGARTGPVTLPAIPHSVSSPEAPTILTSLARPPRSLSPSSPRRAPGAGPHGPRPTGLKSKYTFWTRAEDTALLAAVKEFGFGKNKEFSKRVPTKTPGQCA
jgi:hypothetical protein